jgi:hypothetical protein
MGMAVRSDVPRCGDVQVNINADLVGSLLALFAGGVGMAIFVAWLLDQDP